MQFTGSRDDGHAIGTVPWSMSAKFEVRTFSVLELLAFNAHRGHVTLATLPVRKFLQRSCLDFPWEHAKHHPRVSTRAGSYPEVSRKCTVVPVELVEPHVPRAA